MKNLFLITIIFLLSCNMAYAKRYINLADSLITDKDNVYEVSKLDNVVCNPLNKCKTDFYIVVYMKNEDKQKVLNYFKFINPYTRDEKYNDIFKQLNNY
ncbi:MAG: hypothetical protein WDK95_14280 [Syntrophorhabdaceae bacterium]